MDHSSKSFKKKPISIPIPRGKENRNSVWKSGLKTAKRPPLDRTKTGKDWTSGPVF